jgi:hypothetical protein
VVNLSDGVAKASLWKNHGQEGRSHRHAEGDPRVSVEFG